MDGIFVDEATRDLGIGRKLLEVFFVYGTEHGFKKAKLGVIDANPRAKALYGRVGFVVQAKKNMGMLKWVLVLHHDPSDSSKTAANEVTGNL